MAMSVPPECAQILHEVTAAAYDVEQAQQRLEAAAPGETVGLLQQYRAVTRKLYELQDSLANCLADSYQLEASLTGTASVTVEGLRGSSNISFPILLNKARTAITLASFPPMNFTSRTPVGDVTVVLTQTSGGVGTYADGHIVLPLGLHLSGNGGGQRVNSDISVTLTTDPPGSPVNPTTFGPVTLVGGGVFYGGVLIDGKRGDLTVAGTISVPRLLAGRAFQLTRLVAR
jgi:hypothetical protein